jgi:TonB family protein
VKTDQHDDLNLWRGLDQHEPVTTKRVVAAGAGIVLYHLLAYTVFVAAINAPGGQIITNFQPDLRRAVPLYIPSDLTQRDPNRGKVTRDLDVRSAAPPAPVPQAPRFRAPEPAPVPIPAAPPPIEAPKVEAAVIPPVAAASPGEIPAVAPPPPPEKPKLAFEAVGDGGKATRPNANPNIRLPKVGTTVEEMLHPQTVEVLPRASKNGGVAIGDQDEFTNIPNSQMAPSAGPVRSNLQLLSDAAGVDFKPYLVKVLTAVRANWLAVIPESARMGRRGRVLVQFIIDRRGGVPKLVIAESSGTAAFDRAAVAGISASKFDPLPSAFKGNEIRLQLAFSYNQPAR